MDRFYLTISRLGTAVALTLSLMMMVAGCSSTSTSDTTSRTANLSMPESVRVDSLPNAFRLAVDVSGQA